MGVRHVSRDYEKGYKPLRGAEERVLLAASCMVVGTVPGAAGGWSESKPLEIFSEREGSIFLL